MFYRKVCEIYATSADYEPSQQKTMDFFATVQNKFHWAVTGKTAMDDWIGKLHGFLTLNEKQTLHDAGRISAQPA